MVYEKGDVVLIPFPVQTLAEKSINAIKSLVAANTKGSDLERLRKLLLE